MMPLMQGEASTGARMRDGSWWRTNLSHTVSQTRLGLVIKDAALALPVPASRALNVVRYLPLYLTDPGLRRQWRADDALERAMLAGERLTIPLDERSADTSERAVEIPWVVSRARLEPGRRVLDVGSAFASHAYRRLLAHAASDVELHLVDLVRCRIPGATSHQADARALPFDDASFNSVICISTLEHVGMDNVAYGIVSEGFQYERPDVAALRELGRVARHDPGVLVTVPAGDAGDLVGFRQYSAASWVETVTMAGLQVHALACFVHSPTGWRAADATELESRSYGEGARAAAGLICSRLSRRSSSDAPATLPTRRPAAPDRDASSG